MSVNKCEVTNNSLLEIQSKVRNLAIKHRKDALAFKNELQNYLKTLTSYDARQAGNIVSSIMPLLKRWESVDSQFFNEDNLVNIIRQENRGVQILDLSQYGVDKLDQSESAKTKKEANRDFLTKAYGTATAVRQEAERQVLFNLANSVILTRNRKDADGNPLPGRLITSEADLQQNIREYKETLLQEIVKYLKTTNEEYFKENPQLLDNARMFDDSGEYTGIMEQLRPYLDLYLKPANFSSETLKRMRKYKDIRLGAYNAMITLDHFDTYISLIFKDSIDIKNFNVHTFKNYGFTEKLAELTKTWKTNDEDRVEEHVSGFVKALINTTPIYAVGSHTPKEGKFLKFNDFAYIISKVKKTSYNPKYYKTEPLNDQDVLNSLSPRTRVLVEGKSVAQVISKMRVNPQAYLSAIFELMSNPILKSKYNRDLFNKVFTNNDLELIYSMHKGLFSTVDENSSVAAISLQNVMAGNNYYEYIAQVADSIFAVDFVQYYTEDEMLNARELHSQGVDNIRRDLEQQIQLAKTRKNKKPFVLDVFEKSEGNSLEISFDVPNTNINITVGTDDKVTYKVNGYKLELINKDTFNKLIPFIQEQLQITLDDDLMNALLEQSTAVELWNDLVQFASRVVKIDYVNHNKISEDITEIKKIKDAIFKDSATLNYQLNELSLVHTSDVKTIRLISRAKGFLRGLERAAVVRTSEGDALGTTTNSRLTGALHNQFENQCKNENSVTKNCLLITRPELFKGIYTVKEVKKDTKSKAHVNFSVSEFAYAHTVADFIQGLMPQKYSSSVMGSGVVGLIPSVNSDKPTISRILIDLNTEINGLAIKDMSEQQLLDLIDSEFREIYRNTYENVQKDLDKVFLYLNELVTQESPLYGAMFAGQVLNNFETFNTFCRERGLVPYDTLMGIVNTYNQIHKKDPIVFIDQVHFINNGGDLKTNPSLLGLLYRHNAIPIPDNLVAKYGLIKSSDFFNIKHKEVLKSLIDSGFELNVWQNDSLEFQELRKNASKYIPNWNSDIWVDKSGDLILAKVKVGDSWHNITNQADIDGLRGTLSVSDFLKSVQVELNPIHKRMNLLDSLFTQEFMNTTVGSFIAHPAKVKNADFLTDAAARFQAQHKRNVSMTASMHEFLLNSLKGIPTDYNISILEDVKDVQSLVSGDIEDGIKPFDGATFVNPFIVYLENYSLGGSKAGITKKQFVHFYDEHTGTGGIIKTAGFGFTNDTMRNSPYQQLMMERMTDRTWDGAYNILKDYNGNDIKYLEDGLFFRHGDDFFKITNIEYLPVTHINDLGETVTEYKYRRHIAKTERDGKIVEGTESYEDFTVDSNYKLWQLFGGYMSCSLNSTKTELDYSEASIAAVVKAMNNYGVVTSTDGEVRDGNDVYQPLKHTDIHYVATVGAVKQGAANINKNLNGPLNFMKVRMAQAGIQLDKEHHADESELSMMTQVISACSARGFTMESAQNLYKALADIAKINLSSFTDAFGKLIKGDTNAVRETVVKVVIDGLVNAQNTDSFIHKVAESLIAEAKEGKVISFNKDKIPVSANEVYNQFVSAVSVFMTNAGIKRKISGILSVLTPSFGIMKLYNGKKYEQILIESQKAGYSTVYEYLEYLQETEAPIVYDNVNGLNRKNVYLGRTYRLTYKDVNGENVTELRKINTPLERKQLIDEAFNYTSIKEDITKGRDLGSYDAFFNDDLSIYDLDSVISIFNFKKLQEAGDQLQIDLFVNSYFYGKKDNVGNVILEDPRIKNPKYVEQLIRRDIQQDLLNLQPDKLGGYVKVNNELIQVNQVEVIPYELIMPKIFATNFGLKQFDSIQEIVDNPEFFRKRLESNYNVKALSNVNYDIALKNIRGEHVLLALSSESFKGMIDITNQCIFRTDESGNTFRQDRHGNVIYQMKLGDRIFVDASGVETIVTEDPVFYLNSMSYFDIEISQNAFDKSYIDVIKNSLKKSHNKQARYYYNSVFIKDTNYKTNAIEYDKEQKQVRLAKMGLEIHNSFLKSLNVVAARIPAQSMQSFMPMRVVGFDNPDINTAYVSTAQILLQGSDFDIDAVSLATYAIDKTGKLPLWSPYADLSTYSSLEASLKLPIPTGQALNLVEYNATANSPELKEFLQYITNSQYFNLIRNENNELILSLNEANLEGIIELINWANNGDLKIPTEATKMQLVNAIEKLIQDGELPGLRVFKLDEVNSLFSQIAEVIDRHNLYLNKVGRHTQDQICNNIEMSNMFSIIANPANLLEAQSPVDSTVKPLKDKGNESANATALKTRSDGNFVNKMESIEDNQVGKKCIGISATGIKGFFGATQYCNWILAHGTPEQKLRLQFECNMKIDGESRKYSLLANIRGELNIPEGTDPITANKLKSLYNDLQNADQDNDYVLILSAMLSLATDNAKELKLAQLNALEKTIGMYLYGISVGIPFNDLANILMSPLALTMTQLMKGNTFINKDNIQSLDAVFDYFELGPNLESYNIATYDNSGNRQTTSFEVFKRLFSPNAEVENKLIGLDTVEKIQQTLVEINSYEISEPNNKTRAQVYKLIKEVSTYLRHKLMYLENIDTYNNIKELAKGAADLKDLGQILGLNKGLKTSSEDIQRQVSNIEEILNTRVDRFLKEKRREYKTRRVYLDSKYPDLRFDIMQFVLDPEYRQQQIERYERIKVNYKIGDMSKDGFITSKSFVNPLELIATVPHYFEYVKSLAYTDAGLKDVSVKYRSIAKLSKQLQKEYKPTNTKAHIKNTQNLISNYLNLQWRFDNDFIFDIPKGNIFYDSKGDTSELMSATTPIKLGTPSGDLTFKAWMENEVFPNLKKGKLGTHKQASPIISNNEFVKHLIQIVYTNASDHQEKINQSLDINMLPSDEYEQDPFDTVSQGLEQLSRYTYNNYPIIELLFLYNQIAFDGKLGQKSFTKLLENYHNLEMITGYYEYIKYCDDNLEIESADIPQYLKHTHMTQYGSIFSSFAPYVYSRNKTTGQLQLFEKVDQTDDQTGMTQKYRVVKPRLVDKVIPTEAYINDTEDKAHYVEIQPNGTKIGTISYQGKTYSFKSDNVNIPYKKENGQPVLDVEKLQSYIERKINC